MQFTEFQEKLKQETNPVVIDLWATWCGPCKLIEPALHQLEQEYAGRVTVWKVNADEERALLAEMGVLGIPTLLVFKDGREITRQTGARPLQELRQLFEAGLTGLKPPPRPISLTDRLVRGSFGLALAALTWHFNWFPLMYLLAGAVFFTAVYDRCPIWQAIAPRLQRWVTQKIISNGAQTP